MVKRIVQFYLFRHGETDWNREGRFQGHTDVPLNDNGKAQARKLIPVMRRISPEIILTSDLSRACETARIAMESVRLSDGSKPRHFQFKELREAHLGMAEGLTREEIVRKLGHKTLERWRSDEPENLGFAYPGGETGLSVLKRAIAIMEKTALDHPQARKIAVCTHGGVIRRILTHIAGPDYGQFPVSNGILYQLEWNRITKHWNWIPELDWNPQSEVLVITRDGQILSNDCPIEHQRTAQAFFRNIIKTGNTYRIRIGFESIRVHVESTPLFVLKFREQDGEIIIYLSSGEESILRLDSLYMLSENELRCRLDNGLEAGFSPSAYHEFLVRHLHQDEHGFWVVSGNQKKQIF